MAKTPQENRASTLVVDESFAAGDDRFIEQVRSVTEPKYLAGLVDRWKKDPRPWAREQVLAYLGEPLDRPGHHVVVKRLFKQAEGNRDDQLMAAFLVAFDRLIRRRRRMKFRWDRQTRQSWQEEELFAPRDQIIAQSDQRLAQNPKTLAPVWYTPRLPRQGRLFSYKTRQYLRRRAWRYFRFMGYQRPDDYPLAVARALALYRDQDVAAGENILDCWSLMNLAFCKSAALVFSPTQVKMADGATLGQLAAAPRFPELWKKPESAAVLFKLVTHAQSRLVRVWATQLLRLDHETFLSGISADDLLMLLDHSDSEVQQFGATLLQTLKGVDAWPIATWLRLLETQSTTALATICDTMAKRVRPERLDLDQCLALARARATPVARMGLSLLSGRPIITAKERQALVGLAGARCEAVGAEAAAFALVILGQRETYRTDWVTAFFDSLNPAVRRGAWEWLTPQSPGYEDSALWSRLMETPYDDVRIRLVNELDKRTRSVKGPLAEPLAPALRKQDLTPIWTAVLLGVHRGGRAKLKALRQISQAVADHPEQAERLLPVLTVAIRSVRPPEARAGLAAVLTAVALRPEIEVLLAHHLPELRLGPQAVAS